MKECLCPLIHTVSILTYAQPLSLRPTGFCRKGAQYETNHHHTGHSIYLISEPTFYPDFSIYTKQHELLRELSRKSDCVIVGRCADYILREQKPVRIFAYADMESRIKRCMERRPEDEHLTEAQMKKRIAEIDRSRAKYYAFFSEQKWGARENYDLLVNTSGADIKKLSSALCAYLEAMFE